MDTSIIINAMTLRALSESNFEAQKAAVEKEHVEPFFRESMPHFLARAKDGYPDAHFRYYIQDDRKRDLFLDIVIKILKQAGYKYEYYVQGGTFYLKVTW